MINEQWNIYIGGNNILNGNKDDSIGKEIKTLQGCMNSELNMNHSVWISYKWKYGNKICNSILENPGKFITSISTSLMILLLLYIESEEKCILWILFIGYHLFYRLFYLGNDSWML